MTFAMEAVEATERRLDVSSSTTNPVPGMMEDGWLYAVKAQTSLAPLSWFHGSHVTTAHAHHVVYFTVMRRLCRRE